MNEVIERMRRPWTVQELRELLADLPGDMPVKVDHEPASHSIGMQSPVIRVCKIATIVDSYQGRPVFGQTGDSYVVIE